MNPELARNLWLDAQRRQLILGGAVLAAFFVGVWLVDRGHRAGSFVVAGAVVFAVCALAWGPRAARASVIDEVQARTWDLQRLSALTPWTLTWAKLAGAAHRPWSLAAGGMTIALLQLASIAGLSKAAFWLMIGVELAILMQASGLSAGLVDIRKARALERAPGHRSPALWLMGITLLAAACLVWAQGHAVWRADIGAGLLTASRRPIQWWDHPYDADGFAAWTLALLAGWAVVCAWRLMRLELQFLNVCWAWPLFLAAVAVLAAGFQWGAPEPAELVLRRLRQAGATFAACAYVGAFADPADRVQARQFGAALMRFDLAEVSRGAPLVLAPTTLAIVTLAALAALDWRVAGRPDAALIDLALVVVLLRDLGLIGALRFASRGARGDLGVLLKMAVIYVAGALLGRALGGTHGAALFVVSVHHPAQSLVAGAPEAALALGFAAWRISRPAQKPPNLRTAPVKDETPPTSLQRLSARKPA